jgi:hypothetical protein
MGCVTWTRSRAGAYLRPAAAAAARVALIGTALALLAVGCGSRGHERRAPRLVDGTSPPALPDVLAAERSAAVQTRVHVLHASQLGAPGRACLARFRPEFSIPPTTTVVERIGAIGASITLRDGQSRVVLGCDRTDALSPGGGPWCAASVGRLFNGRVRDPRVDILCHSAAGERIGFGWMEPAPATRWLVARTARSSEVYEVAAGLPVRLATTDVDIQSSSAGFDMTEYDADGKEVRSGRLDASVAG